MITVEVVYIGEKSQAILTVTLDLGDTVLDAIAASNILQKFPEFNLTESHPESHYDSDYDSNNSNDFALISQTLAQRVGIFGKIVPLTRIVKQGDRIEIYRPLKRDPKDARRARTRQSRKLARIKKNQESTNKNNK